MSLQDALETVSISNTLAPLMCPSRNPRVLQKALAHSYTSMADRRYSLFVGDVNGQYSEVFAKVRDLHTKHNFAFVVITGNLFADPASDAGDGGELSKLLRSEVEVPITTYFSLGSRELPQAAVEKLEANDGELCPNLYVLGRKTTVKTSEGFKIVAVGGKYVQASDEAMNSYDAIHNDTDAQTAGKDIDQADILVTSEWPAAVQDGSKQLYKGQAPKGTQSIADLCTRLKPRYHFSASEAYYDREPFFQPGDSPRHVTRFISLAPFGNTEKAKSFYAFSIEPSQPPPQNVPDGCTASPFTQAKKRKLDSQQDSFNKFRYANGGAQVDGGRQHARRRKRGDDRYAPPTPDQCFFCLSNKKVQQDEAHMLTSIAENSYMTIAKGPLTKSTTFKGLGFPCHMLLIPLAHAPTTKAIADKDERDGTLKELQQYRDALQEMVAAKSKGNDDVAQLGAVTYEISRAGGVHIHWQFMPMPVEAVNRGIVEAGFEVEAENMSYPKFAKDADAIKAAEQGDFFKVTIWTETFRREMVLPLDSSFRFDLQYGRKVLAKLLKLDNRMDWRACQQTTVEEEADADAFKKVFKAFDPFL